LKKSKMPTTVLLWLGHEISVGLLLRKVAAGLARGQTAATYRVCSVLIILKMIRHPPPHPGGAPAGGHDYELSEIAPGRTTRRQVDRRLVLQVDDALNLGLEGLADLVQQVSQGPIIGGLFDGSDGGADLVKLFEVGFEGIHPRLLPPGRPRKNIYRGHIIINIKLRTPR
jgi:hypothetical protein